MLINYIRRVRVVWEQMQMSQRMSAGLQVILSKLNLVDLAGSERVKKTDTEGAGLEEAKFINRSLTYLEQCVVAATDRGREHIPFRQTKLTNILRDSVKLAPIFECYDNHLSRTRDSIMLFRSEATRLPC